MKNFFANLYELAIRHSEFSNTVFKSEDYVWLGLFLIIIPLILALIFYKFWDPSPTKTYKWIVFVVILSIILIFVASYYQLWTGSLEIDFANEHPEVGDYTLGLSLYNSLYSLIIIIIWSVIIKRFSINNSNNPL